MGLAAYMSGHHHALNREMHLRFFPTQKGALSEV
jgi:hypothetical protein